MTHKPKADILDVAKSKFLSFRHLKQGHLTPLVIDTTPRSRAKAHELGIKLYLGDATNEEILVHGGLREVCMAVVTVPDPMTTIQIVEHLNRLRPQMPIAVCCRYRRHLEAVKKAGATLWIDEETHVGHGLAHQIVDFVQASSGETLACRLVGKPPAADTPEEIPDAGT